ncbi:MAG: DUF2917 domain-containing protein [Opitutaceae bacterium]
MKNNAAWGLTVDRRAPTFRPHVVAHRPNIPGELIQMPRHQVIRLGKTSGVDRIEVKHGAVWLTGTPANGDVIVSTGEHFELRDNWPFVMQALECTELLLLRSLE